MASDTAPENLPYGRRVLRSETGSRQLLSPFEQESTDYAQPDGPGTTTPPPDALPEAEGPAADGQAFARVGPRLSAVPSHNGSVVSSFVDAKDKAPLTLFVRRVVDIPKDKWDKIPSSHTLPVDGVRSRDVRVNVRGKLKRPKKWRSILGLPVMRPQNKVYQYWCLMVLVLDCTYTAFIVPIGVGFSISDVTLTWAAVCDFVAGVLYTLDMGMNFQVGFVVVHGWHKRIIMYGPAIAKYYLCHGTAIIDVFSVTPFIAQVVLIILQAQGGNRHRSVEHTFQFIRVLRLVRLTRLFKRLFMECIGGATQPIRIGGVSLLGSTVAYLLHILFAMAVFSNFLGCLWYWVAAVQDFDNTWVVNFTVFQDVYGTGGELVGADVNGLIPKPRMWLVAVYWALTTVVTVGYGDITPHTVPETVVTILVFVLGILFFGILLGSISDMLQRASQAARRATKFRDKMAAVDSWIKARRFPRTLRTSIRAYYAEIWVKEQETDKEQEFFDELPFMLRHECVWHMVSKALNGIPMFAGLDATIQVQLAEKMVPRREPPGKVLCRRGDAALRLWILTEGSVVTLHQDGEGSVIEDPSVIGEGGLLQEHLAAFRLCPEGYRTTEPCMLWELDVCDVLALCHPGDRTHQHIVQAARDAVLQRIATSSRGWPKGVLTMLQGLRASAPQDDSAGADEAATFAQAGWLMRAGSNLTSLQPRDSLKSKNSFGQESQDSPSVSPPSSPLRRLTSISRHSLPRHEGHEGHGEAHAEMLLALRDIQLKLHHLQHQHHHQMGQSAHA